MGLNPYFNNQGNRHRQDLAEKLIIQAIQTRGIATNFIAAEQVEFDEVLNENTETRFGEAKELEMYVENITNFNGSGDVWQQFGGFTMTDNATLVVSQKRFREVTGKATPAEGDLVYIPYADMTFEVDKLLEDEDFRQWGQNYVFRIRCTKYAFGHEELDTGVDEIDDLELDMTEGIFDNYEDEPVVLPEPEKAVNDTIDDEFIDNELDFG